MKRKEPWLVFFLGGKEILRYSLRGTFPGEKDATIQLLEARYDVPASAIYFAVITA